MKNQLPTMQKAKSLTENLFSLEEPWRDRFLILVAQQATGRAWDKRSPTRDEIVTWLDDSGLHQAVTMLLQTWHGRRPA